MAKVRREINQRAVAGITTVIKSKGTSSKVGWFESSHYPGGVPVALVAAVQELGSPAQGIPPRLGMRTTAKEKEHEWGGVAEIQAHRMLENKINATQAFEAIGLKAAGDVRKHISEVRSPPLKVATVLRRQSMAKQGKVVSVTLSKPLIHTGHLYSTLTNRTDTK